MAQAGDLHWERKSAGEYETAFYANGYRYRIIKKDPYYDSRPRWYIYYRWDKSSRSDSKPLEWVQARMTYSETLKEAKEKCLRHNLLPRTKYKFVGRVTKKDVQDREHSSRHLGDYIFIALDKEGKPKPYSTKYVKPEDWFKNNEQSDDEIKEVS
jgi:hypothetical protein